MKKAKFRNHEIVIDDSTGEEKLFLNDQSIPFIKKEGKYFIYYQSGEASLIEAAKSYLKSQPKK